jgi:hypothetical protein
MALAHRLTDLRSCGANTLPGVVSQSFVTVDGKLWAVQGALSSHGAGAFANPSVTWVKIDGLSVVTVGDLAAADTLCATLGGLHCAPTANAGSLINVSS